MFLYLDASAIVKLAVRETETAAVDSALAQCRAAFTSKLSRVECARAIARISHPRAATTLAEAFEALVLHEINDAVLARAGALKPASLRSHDAIHLATALLLDADNLSFVTYDDKLADAAQLQGLHVTRPGR